MARSHHDSDSDPRWVETLTHLVETNPARTQARIEVIAELDSRLAKFVPAQPTELEAANGLD